jgi:Zn-dependent M16 (insulinase) family peptidase
MRRVTPILASREFQNVHAASSSAAHVYLTGSVPDDETLADLREKLIRVFGTEEADAMIRTVDVSNERLPRSENDGS